MMLDNEKHWDGNLEITMFKLHETVHTITIIISVQLLPKQDLILDTCHEANWQLKKFKKINEQGKHVPYAEIGASFQQ